MIQRLLLVVLATTFLNFAFSQDSPRKPLDLVTSAKKSGENFSAVDLFQLDLTTSKSQAKLEDRIQAYNLLDINTNLLQSLSQEQPAYIRLKIPATFTENIELELVKVDILSTDFSVVQRSDNSKVNTNTGVHYRGIIKGDEHSIAAISFLNGEMSGLISSDNGNLVLGKLQGRNDTKHILYDDFNVITDLGLDCGTSDDGIGYKDSDLRETDDSRAPSDCIRLYMEVDKDIHDNKGGVAGATNFVTGLMNQVITIYANENITAVVSQIVVWDVTSPYSSSSSSGMLSDFQSNTGSFNGDLGQLLSYQASGGIAAGFSGICNNNTDNSLSFSSINSTYSTVPTYSWSVMVVSHEFGHLWGSRHTHACVWNGNNTAIDGCAGGVEGGCSLPGYPSQGGTMMSYCHLQSVGINFNEGFGPQPGNVIRNSVANASCTSSCGPPSCTDNIQNGDETGVDCGGSSCPACPSCNDGVQNGDETGVDCGGPDCAPCPCNGTLATVTINLDNYPEETSWNITSGGQTVASGGTYGSQADGSTVAIDVCLPDGCYDFTINDTYGDGICCAYGSGSYTVTGNGSTYASGGSFGSSETTNFCVGGGPAPTCNDGIQNQGETGVDCGGPCAPCPVLGCTDANAHNYDPNANQDDGSCETCNDGIQNGDETGVDCGGSLCAPCDGGGECTYQTINFNNFEGGWGIWNDGGSDCRRSSNDANYALGTYCVRLRDNTSTSVMTTDNLNLSSYEELTVEWSFYSRSMENNEDFWVQVSTNGGSSYATVASFARGVDFNNNTRYNGTVVIPGPFSSNTRLRFRNDASGNSDWIYVDEVNITGCLSSGTSLTGPGEITTTTNNDNTAPTIIENDLVVKDLSLYPNPTNSNLTVSFRSNQETEVMLMVMDLQGRQLHSKTLEVFNGKMSADINVADYAPGIYLLHLVTPKGHMTQKFVVTR